MVKAASLKAAKYLSGVVLLMAFAGCATRGPVSGAVEKPEREQFHVRDGKLMRGGSPFTFRAFEADEVGSPESGLVPVSAAMNQSAAVGGNAIRFDLYGYSPSGDSISEEGVAAVEEIVHLANWRHARVICRVLGPDAPRSFRARKRAVRTAGEALQTQTDVLYWIDGRKSKQLARAFHRAAPELCIAATKGGAVDIVESMVDANPERPAILEGAMPEPGQGAAGYVLPPTMEWYLKHDKAMADPIEFEPWTPDNSVLSEEERNEGWIALFDGKTFNGWKIEGNPECWQIKDGAIEWVRRGGGVIRSRDRYDNFMLRFEWKIEEGGNSGVFLRAPRACRQSKIGFEFQLHGDAGTAAHKDSTGAVYDVVAPKANPSKPIGEWNSVEVYLHGPRYRALLNGVVIQDLSFEDLDELKPRLRNGFIGLQDHGNYVAFRNIRIKPL